jgi:glycosyltransferase involved in cell wall biosynthesis
MTNGHGRRWRGLGTPQEPAVEWVIVVYPEVSVLVPTRNRPETLGRCLRALTQQTIRRALEIVVVDDGSMDRESVARVVANTPGVRLVRQPAAGVASARNTAIDAARAPFLCLVDDDCTPVADWAERLRAALAAGEDAAAGPTLNGTPRDAFGDATQTIVNYLAAKSAASRATLPFAPGSNLAFTAETARALPFDEGYGPGGEDRDWCARLARSGRTLVWEPRAIVRHHQELTFTSFVVKHLNWGRGAHRFRRAHPDVPLLETPGFYAGLIARGFEQGLATGVLVGLAQLATTAGYLDDALFATRGRHAGRISASGQRRAEG